MPGSVWHWLALVIAAMLAAAGVAILGLALFRDRAKRSPRCPKCWYSMAGAPGLKCPECGHEVRHARRLLKTRRRWRRAAIGVVMLIIAAATAIGEPMLRKGVVHGTPTWAYIVALPWLEERGEGMKEVHRRARDGAMHAWEYRALVSQVLDELENSPDPQRAASLVEMLDTLFYGAVDQFNKPPYLSWARPSDLDTPRMASTLLALLDNPDDHALLVVYCLRHCRKSAAAIVPALMCQLFSERGSARVEGAAISLLGTPFPDEEMMEFPLPGTRVGGDLPTIDREFNESIKAAGSDVGELVGAFSRGLRHDDAEVRLCSIWGLFHLARNQPKVQSDVFSLAEDPSEEVRAMVVAFAGLVPVTQTSLGVLRANLADADPVRRLQALIAARMLGPEGRVLENNVRPLLSDKRVRQQAARCWLSIGAPREYLRDVLREAIAQARDDDLPKLLHIAAHTGEGAPEMLQVADQLLQHPRSEVRTSAAYASIRLGGDIVAGTRVLVAAERAYRSLGDAPQSGSSSELLFTLADLQLLDIPPLVQWLTTDKPTELAFPVSILASCGSSAADALPALRALKPDSPRLADYVADTIKRIEWEVRHPKQAAELRRQRIRD